MKILLVTQYFWPEHFIINDFVKELKSQGHQVVVATGKPNYPDGEIFDGYFSGGTSKELFDDDVEVIRIPLRPRGSGGGKNLLLNYLSFVINGLFYFPWLLKGLKFDVVMVFAPSPIIQTIPAVLLKWLKKSHLVLWVQDLWPESLEATGFIQNKIVLGAVGFIVRCIYLSCDTILLQSRLFEEPVSLYAAKDKLIYFPNSVKLTKEVSKKNDHLPVSLFEILDNNFSVVFAGNIGTAQAVESIIQAAILLKCNTQIQLVMIGSGSMLSWAQFQKEEKALDNIHFVGRFPASDMHLIFDRSSALLVTLKDEEIFAQTIPSKIQSYLAAGRPIIASLRGEGANVVQEAQAGLICKPENAQSLAQSIEKMALLTDEERDLMGKCGKAYHKKHFDMSQQVSFLVETLSRRANVVVK